MNAQGTEDRCTGQETPGPYDDIINMPHHVSQVHPQMSMYSRATQFAPFSALTGHDAAIRETARLTDSMLDLTYDEAAELDRRLNYLLKHESDRPQVTITYFEPDSRKSGGKYRTVTGSIRKADPLEHILQMSDGTSIPFTCIMDIDGECFE